MLFRGVLPKSQCWLAMFNRDLRFTIMMYVCECECECICVIKAKKHETRDVKFLIRLVSVEPIDYKIWIGLCDNKFRNIGHSTQNEVRNEIFSEIQNQMCCTVFVNIEVVSRIGRNEFRKYIDDLFIKNQLFASNQSIKCENDIH